MQEVSKYTVFNIREYLNGNNEELGEDDLRQVLSEFSCEKNPDVERFAKEQSIEFAKKQQSVTYLVFSTEDAELVGYFAITIKPITVNAESFSNTIKKNCCLFIKGKVFSSLTADYRNQPVMNHMS